VKEEIPILAYLPATPEPPSYTVKGSKEFATTHWTQVLAAGGGNSPESEAALNELCATYWYPVYAYVRRQGKSPVDAQDLTQEFFVRLLRPGQLERLSRARGKFRSFLLVSLKHFLVNDWRRANAQRRGGAVTKISFDEIEAEVRYRIEPSDGMDGELLYEKRWALAVLESVFLALRGKYVAGGRTPQFDRMKAFLYEEAGVSSQAEAARALHMSEGAFRIALHRLRVQYRDLLREEVARTVANPGDVEDELRHLIAVLRR
jgi:DNA-directed RNA polymerase specialized sigma24 family protein